MDGQFSVGGGFFFIIVVIFLLISSGKFIKFLSKISFLNNKIKIQESQDGRSKFEINSADKLGIRHVLVALIYAILIITSLNAVQTISIQIHNAEENWYNFECSGSLPCERLGGDYKIGFFDTGHHRYPSDTLVEHTSNYDLGINTPWLWSIYLACAGFMLIGVLARTIREGNFYMKKHQKRRDELALIPLLALDPDGVLEGRITLPETITPIPPTKLEYLLTIPILTLSILAFPQTFVIVVTDIFNAADARTVANFGGWEMGEFLIHLWITLFAIINCSTALILLGDFHKTLSEDSSILSSEFTGISEEESPVEEEVNYDEPARLDAVIQILEMEMMRAREETAKLKVELKEVNERVVTLNTEIDEKNTEIDDMRAVKESMELVAEKEEDSDGKSLTMADSVFVGDALFGSTKIDQQIVNDPKAIAMAAVEAYRMGRKDS